jgi:AcrR family transcriptional regulator
MRMNKTERPKASDRREQILQAALMLFVERGLLQVSTRQIAQAVGISQPTLYAHFKSRDEIAITLSERAFQMLRDRMESAKISSGTAAERLYKMGQEYVAFGLEQSAAYRVAFMMERFGMNPVDHLAAHTAGKQAFSMLHSLFIDVRKTDDATTAALAQSAWASMHGLVALLLARPEFPWADQSALIETHLRRVCEGAFG